MFGRIRSSPSPSPPSESQSPSSVSASPSPTSPVEWLEVERRPSKLLKDDSLSIYEETLMKLKQGSQRSPCPEDHNLSAISDASMDLESTATISGGQPAVSGFSDQDISNGDSNYGSPNQEKKTGREVSILSLFSNYASNSHQK